MAEQTNDGRFYAKVEPRADGHWHVSVWDGDPFWKGRGAFPASVAERLDLSLNDVARIVRTEAKAQKVARKMLARCEKRCAAKYDREAFVVRGKPPVPTKEADRD